VSDSVVTAAKQVCL